MNLKFLRGYRIIGVAAGAIGLTLTFAAPALAHTPVMLRNGDQVPWASPLVVDGTDPVALFGVLDRCPSTRWARFNMQAGQEVKLAYGIPNQAPENQQSASQLPNVLLIAPDGSTTLITPTIRQPITLTPDGVDISLNLILVGHYQAPAVTGTYSAMLVGGCPASRAVIALGADPDPGGAFDGVKFGSVATLGQLTWWNDTPPGEDLTAAPRPATP